MPVSFETLALALSAAKKYTNKVVENLGAGIEYKGSVAYYSDLPSNPEIGNYYTVLYQGSSGTTPLGADYIWGENIDTGILGWQPFGPDYNYLLNLIDSKSSISTSFSIATSDWSAAVSPATEYVCTKTSTDVTALSAVTASNNIIVNTSDASVQCSAQAIGSLTFATPNIPAVATTIKVVILP